MQFKNGIEQQITHICKMGKEATEAVGRILMRIDMIESKGHSKFEYFREIKEITTHDNAIYELRPDRCICIARVRVLVMTGTRGELWLDEIFIVPDEDMTQGLVRAGG